MRALLSPSSSTRTTFASVESVKAASDVYAPITGSVVEINKALSDNPALVNTAAESDGWFVKLQVGLRHVFVLFLLRPALTQCHLQLSNEKELKSLLNKAAYDAHVKASAQH